MLECFRMSDATLELKQALSALCAILENSLSGMQPGSISPELFRLAKHDNPDAVKVRLILGFRYLCTGIILWEGVACERLYQRLVRISLLVTNNSFDYE